MQIILGTTAQRIPGDRSRPLIQNLGPGNVYVDTDGEVTAEEGFKLVPNATYEFPTPGGNSTGIWIIADAADTDVRVVGLG